ncbi:hypothetical protein M513_08440 [Trichuris suis]|uniref:Uncharacterized protein n=1 Tax=Trichuris suis TaxID=68888 RepID=A0A085M087_9BILA|nr:hypothetical protein M513_08440 [Trichuris suis]
METGVPRGSFPWEPRLSFHDRLNRRAGAVVFKETEARGSNDAVGAPANSPSRKSQYEELVGKRTVILSGDFPPIVAQSTNTVHPRGRWQPRIWKTGATSGMALRITDLKIRELSCQAKARAARQYVQYNSSRSIRPVQFVRRTIGPPDITSRGQFVQRTFRPTDISSKVKPSTEANFYELPNGWVMNYHHLLELVMPAFYSIIRSVLVIQNCSVDVPCLWRKHWGPARDVCPFHIVHQIIQAFFGLILYVFKRFNHVLHRNKGETEQHGSTPPGVAFHCVIAAC